MSTFFFSSAFSSRVFSSSTAAASAAADAVFDADYGEVSPKATAGLDAAEGREGDVELT